MLVALTGSSGFLGSAIAGALRAENLDVRGLSRRGAPIDGGSVAAVRGDLRDADTCARLVDGADVVVHAAGLVRSSDRAALEEINVAATARLAEAACEAGVQRFVHVSSTGVYDRPGGPISEASAFQPSSAYERSKADAETVLAAISGAMVVVIARPSNVIGVGHPNQPLVRFMRSVARRRVAGASDAWVNYVGVTDVARAVGRLAVAPEPPRSMILNDPILLSEFVGRTAAAMSVSSGFRAVPHPATTLARWLVPRVARWAPAADRARALIDTTRFITKFDEWFADESLTMDVSETIGAMVADYRDRRVL